MNALTEIKSRFQKVLDDLVDDPRDLLGMIRPAQDGKFGDYQANCAMPMKNLIGKPPRDIANDLIAQLEIDDLCQKVEVAGPGFINLTLDDQWLKKRLMQATRDERLGVAEASPSQTYVVDFSSPNVAKPMHVGHIRSTVIGDALSRTLRFLGHRVITDNHLGDWGTQFGMIIYGYKHLLDAERYADQPVVELGRLYRQVRQIMDYQSAVVKLPKCEELIQRQQTKLDELQQAPVPEEKAEAKRHKKEIGRLQSKIDEQKSECETAQRPQSPLVGASCKIDQDKHTYRLAKAVLVWAKHGVEVEAANN